MENKRLLIVIIALALILSPAYAVNFETDQFLIKNLIKTGETSTISVRITNTDVNAGEFALSLVGGGGLIDVTEQKFSLDSGETNSVDLRFRSAIPGKSAFSPGIYTGKLNIVSDDKRAVIPIIIELESYNVLFDSNLYVDPQYKELSPRSNLIVDVRVFNLKSRETEQVELKYTIKDMSDKIILTEVETASVDSTTSLTKSFNLPGGLIVGTYVLGVETKSSNSVGISTYIFEVTGIFGAINSIESLLQKYFFSIAIGIAVLILLLTAYGLRHTNIGLNVKHEKARLVQKQKILTELREHLGGSSISKKEKNKLVGEINYAENALLNDFNTLNKYKDELDEEKNLKDKFDNLKRIHQTSKVGKSSKQDEEKHLKDLGKLKDGQIRDFKEKEHTLIALEHRLKAMKNNQKANLESTIRRHKHNKDRRSRAIVQDAQRKLRQINHYYDGKEADRKALLNHLRKKHSVILRHVNVEKSKVRKSWWQSYLESRKEAQAKALALAKERARHKEHLKKTQQKANAKKNKKSFWSNLFKKKHTDRHKVGKKHIKHNKIRKNKLLHRIVKHKLKHKRNKHKHHRKK